MGVISAHMGWCDAEVKAANSEGRIGWVLAHSGGSWWNLGGVGVPGDALLMPVRNLSTGCCSPVPIVLFGRLFAVNSRQVQ
jgi:hypothetical protein